MRYLPWDKSRLMEIVTLWNEELGEYFPMRQQLFEQNSFLDKNILQEGSLLVEDDAGCIIGFIIAKKWQEELPVQMAEDLGWIQVILVKQEERNKGIGSYLLQHAESVFKEHKLKQIRLAGDVWHYFPGIPHEWNDTIAWVEKKGYVMQSDEYDLVKTYSKEEALFAIPDDMEFSLLDYKEKPAFLQFLNRCFPGRWEYEAIKYFEMGGKGREFMVLKKQGNIIGFCRINDIHSPFIAQNVYWDPLFTDHIGGIGPLGVDEQERGQGFGLAIVKAAINFLRKRDIQTMVIDWTTLTKFYGKLGYHPWKGYRTYFKTIH